MATVSDFYKEWYSPCPYVIAHTSGSTGKPKEIRLLKDDMRASARATNCHFGINSTSILGLPLSVDYIAGKMMCVRAIEAGCQLLEMPVSNTISLDCDIDLLSVVPSQTDSLIARPSLAAKIKYAIIGGAPLSKERKRALVSAGYHAYSSYGMTETCSHVALAEVTDDEAVYRAMPGISFSTDERGCLVITAPHFSFGRLVTNDIVTLLDSGSFLWRGRYDNVINSGGIKIAAEELEALLSELLAHELYVVACPDEKWGQVPALVFCGDEFEIEPVRRLIGENVDKIRQPKVIIAVGKLPRTANGKILRCPINDL